MVDENVLTSLVLFISSLQSSSFFNSKFQSSRTIIIMSLDTVHSAVFKINSLPRELLPKIFKCLNVHDRKNVRLTCRLWNDVCNLKEIIEYEKFVFHLGKKGCDLPDLGAHIEECKALRSCLEFQGLPLRQLPSTLWANCGSRVQLLFIHECEVDDATITNIIVHCTNLKTLHLQSIVAEFHRSPIPATLSDSNGLFYTEESIDELITRNIERQNLNSLILYTHEALSARKLQKLFQIFPCLRTLGLGILKFEYMDDIIVRDHCREAEWVFPPSKEIFVSNVEDDILNSLKRSNFKLKKLSTSLNLDSQYNFILDLCDKQKELEKLVLDIDNSRSLDGEDILFLMLRSLPKLKELEIHVYSSEFWYLPEKLSEFFILTSKLESMWLDLLSKSPKHSPLPVIPSSPLVEYSSLKSLTILGMNSNFAYEILRRCRTSLHHLSLVQQMNDEILQLILEVHTELKSLHISLVGLYKPKKDGLVPEGKKYPFRKLRNLKYLRLRRINPDALRNNISEFIFPKLEYFEFNCSSCNWFVPLVHQPLDDTVQNFHEMLRIVCKGAPYLETLKIHGSIFKSSDFVNHFRNVQMKCLRYITIVSSANPYTKKNMKRPGGNFGAIDAVFNACPSLCLITFMWGGHCAYSYDRHLKETKCHPYLKTFDTILYKNIRSI